MKPREPYKVTFMDRHGPEGGLRIKAIAYGSMVGAISFSAIMLIMAQGGRTPGPITVLIAALVGYGAGRGAWAIASKAGDAAQYFTAGGSSTPYEEQFSQEQALIMQRDYAGAAACFEQRIKVAEPTPDIRAVIAGADVYREHGLDFERAAALYRRAQKLPTLTPGQDVYVANKLADLYLGPLKQPGKALVEFRRLIERYPNSRTADQARLALANLKQDQLAENQ